jgi:6-pyruvoyltetrahydropterin/6-carboxytetrahydropterin synthase
MYRVAVKREFIARHYLIGGDWGPENELHAHNYQVEVELEGESLDSHGYLVDIVHIERNLEALISHYRDRTLNDCEEFAGLNPSIEHFARIFCRAFIEGILSGNLAAVTVKLWENEIAWASFRLETNPVGS